MIKDYIIYKTTNLINGKIYVGKDEYNNPRYLGSGTLLCKAFAKYGRINFKKEILEYCVESNHCDKEIYWISKLNCFSPNGYNILNGSFGGDVYAHHPNKELYSKRISNSNTGKVRSDKMKIRYSKCKMGDKNPSKQEWVREKISKTKKGKTNDEKNSMFKVSRTKTKLNELDLQLKGDRWEYLRNKIKCINIKTKEEITLDGVQEVRDYLKISKNKYYNHMKTKEPINDLYVCEKL